MSELACGDWQTITNVEELELVHQELVDERNKSIHEPDRWHQLARECSEIQAKLFEMWNGRSGDPLEF